METVNSVPEPQTEQETTASNSSWQKPVAQSFLFLANGVALGLVFGQFLTDPDKITINWWVFLLGIIGTIGLYLAAYQAI